jgi:gliding motility-associated protein GldC
MKKEVKSINEIRLAVGLDSNRTPIQMEWSATEGMNKEPQECKAMLLSVFDKDHRDTYKIDLWTTEMQVIEMDKFMYQTLRGLADTYFKATNNSKLSNEFRSFVEYFGKQTEVIPKD